MGASIARLGRGDPQRCVLLQCGRRARGVGEGSASCGCERSSFGCWGRREGRSLLLVLLGPVDK